MKQAGFGKEAAMVKNGLCPFCAKAIETSDFKDDLSRKEFGISGLCQACQDDTFGTPEPVRVAPKATPIGPNDWQGPDYSMKPAYEGKHTFIKLTGKSGKTWLVADAPNGGDEVYVQGDPSDGHFKGFGGATLHFPLVDGSKLSLAGPWKSNSQALLDDTGYDATQKHSTFVVVFKKREYDKNHRLIARGVLYKDADWTVGAFDRGEHIALSIARDVGHTVYLYKQSQGGSSCGQVQLEK